MKNINKISVILLLISVMLVIGCIGNIGDVATPTPTPTPTATPVIATATPTPIPATTAIPQNTISMVQQTTNGRTYPTTPLNVTAIPGQGNGGLMTGELGKQ